MAGDLAGDLAREVAAAGGIAARRGDAKADATAAWRGDTKAGGGGAAARAALRRGAAAVSRSMRAADWFVIEGRSRNHQKSDIGMDKIGVRDLVGGWG